MIHLISVLFTLTIHAWCFVGVTRSGPAPRRLAVARRRQQNKVNSRSLQFMLSTRYN